MVFMTESFFGFGPGGVSGVQGHYTASAKNPRKIFCGFFGREGYRVVNRNELSSLFPTFSARTAFGRTRRLASLAAAQPAIPHGSLGAH